MAFLHHQVQIFVWHADMKSFTTVHRKQLASLKEVWAGNKTIKARFEYFLVTGSIHKLSEGVHESESDEKIEQTYSALQRSLTKSVHQMSWELNVPHRVL